MAKKFVRGVTGVDDIESFDKTLTNVNDLISDGQYTYVHTKKGKNELYYKITDGVTSVNSTGGTITVEKSDDGALKLDINPQKVLEHDNLQVDYGISKTTSGNTTKLGIEYTKVPDGFDLNNLTTGYVRGNNLTNAPSTGWCFVETFGEGLYLIQKATYLNYPNTQYLRLKFNGSWIEWREQVGDKSTIDGLLAQKQNKLTALDGISIIGDTISLKVLDGFSDDLNTLTYTCLAKPVENTTNLPNGSHGYGILSVVRIGDVVTQTYQTYSNEGRYIRTGYQIGNNPIWTAWEKIVTQPVS